MDGFPEVSRQLMLFVRAQPEVAARSTQHGVPGETIHVECVVASVPPPRVSWYFQQAPVPLGEYALMEEGRRRRGGGKGQGWNRSGGNCVRCGVTNDKI